MKNKTEFTHLHVHTEYSLLDGSSKISELIEKTKELGMNSIAITDHGVMYGVIDFYKAAKKAGVKPIIGCEVYVASGSRFNKESSADNFYYHLVLLAKNNDGCKNLSKLVSYGFTEGFYYKPRVDIELLKKYSDNLIALSACLAGPVARNILKVSYEKAKETALIYNEIFGEGNFYLELQDHGLDDQRLVNQALMRMNKETGIPLVCTNDLHYINKEDAQAHDILLCIQTGKTINDENRMRYEGSQFYLKSAEEMAELFPYAPEAVENTNKIAERCNVEFEFNKYKLPVFDVPDNMTALDYLKKLCRQGLKQRYNKVTKELEKRLEYEIETIGSMGFVDYFLIVSDFIKYAKDNDIMVGPGRGSAAGSIVAYCLHITDIDPIKYDLLFERFLNPERVSMPDIDIDFCYERRQEVIDYVTRKYGEDHVSQIITFGTMAARNAIRDVGRALAMPYADVDKIAKMIPMELKITIKRALVENPDLAKIYNENENVKNLIDMSLKLEGLPRHSSTHAAGVVICDRPIIDYVPLSTNDDVVTTQYTMTTIEELGLLKMDFLGLRTLSVIQNAFREINRNHGLNLTLDDIDYDDKNVFELISSGKTDGIFQLESVGMKQFMKELRPNSIDDIIAGISLYRPGPMDFIPKYIQGKNHPESITYTHPALKEILKSTYGCIVYQEQVMQIVRELAGYSLGRSDLVRRAMSKKKTDVMAQERQNFIYGLGDDVPGCIKNGIDEKSANKIFDEMTDFAKYAFNKSHAAAYAVVAYQTAWLKNYYPVEFMAALLTSIMDNTSKVSQYIAASKKIGIDMLPPDINEGFSGFSVSNGKIRFGLSAIKNVGRANIKALVKNREENGAFVSLTDFLDRLGSNMNTRCIESLIKAGAFDSLGGKRAQYIAVYKSIYNGLGQSKKKNIEGQLSLFNLAADKDKEILKDDLPNVSEFSKRELLGMEKDILGIYVSGHPLSEYETVLSRFISANSLAFSAEDDNNSSEGSFIAGTVADGQKTAVGGMISYVTTKYTKTGKPMAFVGIEDLVGTIEIILFSDSYSRYSSILSEGSIILVNGRVTATEGQNSKVICESITPYEELEGTTATLWLKIPKQSDVTPENIRNVVSLSKGKTPVIIYDEQNKKKLRLNEVYWVKPTENLINDLKALLGEKSVVLKNN